MRARKWMVDALRWNGRVDELMRRGVEVLDVGGRCCGLRGLNVHFPDLQRFHTEKSPPPTCQRVADVYRMSSIVTSPCWSNNSLCNRPLVPSCHTEYLFMTRDVHKKCRIHII